MRAPKEMPADYKFLIQSIVVEDEATQKLENFLKRGWLGIG
jgi:hypothetical protein